MAGNEGKEPGGRRGSAGTIKLARLGPSQPKPPFADGKYQFSFLGDSCRLWRASSGSRVRKIPRREVSPLRDNPTRFLGGCGTEGRFSRGAVRRVFVERLFAE